MVQRGEIYLVSLGDSIGSEQGGCRPAVIVQNDIGNAHSPTTLICPLTSKSKRMNATHVSLTTNDAELIADSTVLCEQTRVIDKSRIKKRLGQVKNLKKIEEINQKILVSFGMGELCTHQ